jgi:hypothetical protein
LPVQELRRSHFIFNFGPGSILETGKGPRLVPSIEKGLNPKYYTEAYFKKLEISDTRLRGFLKMKFGHDTRIFSLPVGYDGRNINKEDDSWTYKTYVFPVWRLCYNKKGHKKNVNILYKAEIRDYNCPECKESKNSEPVRFIAVCSKGHLDEVPWEKGVHGIKTCKNEANRKYFYWIPGGSSLGDITIECPYCGAKTNMGEIYRDNRFKCTGRHPERETAPNCYRPSCRPNENYERCDSKMVISQRQSTSIYVSEVLTFLTITDDGMLEVIQNEVVENWLNALKSIINKTEKKVIIESLGNTIKDKDTFNKIKSYIENKEDGIRTLIQLHESISRVRSDGRDYLYEEFEMLIGHDPSKNNDYFKMSGPTEIEGNDRWPPFKVYGIERIRTVTALVGFKRLLKSGTVGGDEPGESKLNDVGNHFESNNDDVRWYPGFEGFGEGILIRFSEKLKDSLKNKKAFNSWNDQSRKAYVGMDLLWGDKVSEPLFVYLHTVSHALIRAISKFSGYSSASLKERIYINRQSDDGAILIYGTSPGSEGNMGGLTESVNHMKEIMEEAFRGLEICSNDPLCYEINKTNNSMNGSACYSCLLISETSCENRNIGLDRHMVVG